MLENGALIRKALEEGYDLIVTTDQNIRYQQNLTGKDLAIVVLMATSWPRVQLRIEEIRKAIDQVAPGEVREVPIPFLAPDR
ncbi:MAG: hypothetical protein OXF68_01410 [Gammaproteobacteria bacterium]|nr:hypothetical protein [Gammaproteobacteria bacterium]